jgi:hypothetical protein
MLISMAVERDLYAAVTGVDAVAEFADAWKALGELGWVSITPARLELVGEVSSTLR